MGKGPIPLQKSLVIFPVLPPSALFLFLFSFPICTFGFAYDLRGHCLAMLDSLEAGRSY